jgi:sulfate adenylyltransferase large subunit
VDDGKSTLLGRLLYDSQSVYEDQLHAVRRASRGDLELALLTDGLRAEREQGITIDVAYRYFGTAKRKFILADTPGHEQYTRNMATGASNADLAILLVDASRGVQPQSKRHAYIIGLLGIRHLVVLINKMDLVEYSESVFLNLREELSRAIADFAFDTVEFFPVSANSGINVVHRSLLTPWFGGPALLEYLESVDLQRAESSEPFRLPVQLVQRTSEFRGYSGQIAAGTVSVGDHIVVLPSGLRTRVKSIVIYDGELASASAPQSVTLTVTDEVDISRGDILVSASHPPEIAQTFRSQMIWFSEQPLNSRRKYLLKHAAHTTRARVEVESKLNIHSLLTHSAQSLNMNDIATVTVEADRPLVFDAYAQNRRTGSFILIDPDSNNTVAAGMITGAAQSFENKSDITGLLVSLSPDDPALDLVEHYASTERGNVVIVSNWNRKAIDLLTNAGIHVVIKNASSGAASDHHDCATIEQLLEKLRFM